MWSTVTAILFFSPQSLANLSTHVSYSGTKWLHCTIDSDLLSASARDTNGAERAGAAPAAARVRPASFKKRRLVTRESLLPIILITLGSSSLLVSVVDEAGPDERLASSTGA